MKKITILVVLILQTMRAGTDYSLPAAPDNIYFSPDNVYDAPSTSDITIDFGAPVDLSAVTTQVEITKTGYRGYIRDEVVRNGYAPIGTWTQNSSSKFTFNPTYNQEAGMLIVITVPAGSYGATTVPATQHGAFLIKPSNVSIDGSVAVADTNVSPDPNNVLIARARYSTLGGATPNKVLFWVHGGAWASHVTSVSGSVITSKAEKVTAVFGEFLCKYYPITIVSLPYREMSGGPTCIFDNALGDLRTAIDYVHAHPTTFNAADVSVTANQAFAGGSAGTPLASLLALERHADIFVGFNGIYDFDDTHDQYPMGVGGNFPDIGTGQTARVKFAVGAKHTTAAVGHSALSQISGTPPKILLMHGDADTTIDIEQSLSFYDAITGPKSMVVMSGSPHAVYRQSQGIPAVCLWEMIRFLKANGFL